VVDQRSARDLAEAVAGADAVYAIAPNMSPHEVTMGAAVVEACRGAGVQRLVYHSVVHPQLTAMPHHADKGRVEELTIESDLAWTILQFNAYLQNLDGYLDGFRVGRYRIPYSVDRPSAMVDLRDVAEVAAGWRVVGCTPPSSCRGPRGSLPATSPGSPARCSAARWSPSGRTPTTGRGTTTTSTTSCAGGCTRCSSTTTATAPPGPDRARPPARAGSPRARGPPRSGSSGWGALRSGARLPAAAAPEWHAAGMGSAVDDARDRRVHPDTGGVDPDALVACLRAGGARFAFVHGSRLDGLERPSSDVDVAAWFGSSEVDVIGLAAELPGEVDLVVLDTAPLELAGRVAMHGGLLFDDDPPARVEWQATTRKIHLDERPRVEQARRDFADAMRGLARHGLIEDELAADMARAVGFRNVPVHRYAAVDDGLVVDRLARLDVIEGYVDEPSYHL